MIRLDGADQHVGLGLGIIHVDLGGSALADQIGETPDVALCAFQACLIPGEHALGLLDLRVDLARIERKQHIAFGDFGAVLEMHPQDGGFDPRLQCDARNRRHCPDRVDIDRYRFALRFSNFDRDDARTLRSLSAGAAAGPGGASKEGGQCSNAQHGHDNYQITVFHSISSQPVRKDRDSPISCP